MARADGVGLAFLFAAAGVLASNGCSKTNAPLKSSASHVGTEALKAAPNGSPITISGTVASARPDEFTLDYGQGFVTVEMDDWDWYSEGHPMLENDDVVVQGFIDEDFYEKRKIEASSVYVRDLGTQFHASGVDEEDYPMMIQGTHSPAIEVSGYVTQTTQDDFEVDTGMTSVRVDIEEMPYDPLDDEGFQQIDVGDYVRVMAVLEPNVFDGRALSATSIVSLQ